MIKKIMFSLILFSASAVIFASSTPVGQGIPFPTEAPNQKAVHANAKRNNRPPVAQPSAPALLRYDNKRS